jgi:TP901 family phage tail tape measure protein
MSRVPLGRLEIDLVALTEKFIAGLDSAEKRLDKFADLSKRTIGELGEKLSIGLTAPLAAGALAAVAASETVSKAMVTLRAQTGATGLALDELGKSLRTVAARSDASFQQIARVQAELYRSANLSGRALEGVTEAVLEMSEKLGGDAVAASRGASQALRLYNVPLEQIDETLGQLAIAQQRYGVAVNDTLADLASSGPIFQAYRLNLSQSIDLIGRLRTAGVEPGGLNRGLRTFLTDVVPAGVDPQAQLNEVIEGLRNAASEAQAAQAAMDLFGEAAGIQLAAAVRTGGLSLEALGEAAGNGKEAFYGFTEVADSLTDELAKLRNQATLALEPIGIQLTEKLRELIPVAERTLGVLKGLADWFSKLSPRVQDIIVKVAAAVVLIGPLLVTVSSVVVAVAAAWPVLAAIGGVIAAIVVSIGALLTLPVIVFLTASIGLAYAIWKRWDDIKALFADLPNVFLEAWAHIRLSAETVINTIELMARKAIGRVVDQLKSLASPSVLGALSGINPGLGALVGVLAASGSPAVGADEDFRANQNAAGAVFQQTIARVAFNRLPDSIGVMAPSGGVTAASSNGAGFDPAMFPGGLVVTSTINGLPVLIGRDQLRTILATQRISNQPAAAGGVVDFETLLASRRKDPGREAALSLAQSLENPDERYQRLAIALTQAARDYPNILTPDLVDRGLTKYLRELQASRESDPTRERIDSLLRSVNEKADARRVLYRLRGPDGAFSELSRLTTKDGKRNDALFEETLIDVRRQLAALGDDAEFQLKDRIGGAVEQLGQQFSSEFGKMLATGEGTFENLATSFTQMLATIVTQTLIADPIVRAFRQLINVAYYDSGTSSSTVPFLDRGGVSANGNVFASGRVVPFAAGGVAWSPSVPVGLINRPTLFPMANGGMGLAGEAGPEVGIAPLERIGGRLGVRSTVPNVLVQVVDQRQGGARPEVQESRSSDGQRVIRVLIRDEVRNAIAEGAFDRQLQASFPSVTRRPPAR